jgi:hypothetical protein
VQEVVAKHEPPARKAATKPKRTDKATKSKRTVRKQQFSELDAATPTVPAPTSAPTTTTVVATERPTDEVESFFKYLADLVRNIEEAGKALPCLSSEAFERADGLIEKARVALRDMRKNLFEPKAGARP